MIWAKLPAGLSFLVLLSALLMPCPLISETPPRPREPVRGLYCSGWAAGSPKLFNSIVDVIDKTDLNAIVIDIKGDNGRLSYQSSVPLSRKYRTGQAKIGDIGKVMAVLKEKGIFPIARIVAFKDPVIAAAKPEWAVRDTRGGIWTDDKGMAWVDPYNRQYWDYLIDLAREAIELGFEEIQFDYVRFTSDGNISTCVYPFNTRVPHEDLIAEFLRYARERLAAHGKPIAADIFGLSTSLANDIGIGQKFEKVAAAVDVVCPMVYPSHYGPGNFGLDDPDLHPYTTVFNGVSDGVRRLRQMGSQTIMRPWLQAFSLNNPYKREQLQAQIKAVQDAGATEWLFWNPRCHYKVSDFN